MAKRLDYSRYNFDVLVEQLQNRLKEQDVWKDMYRSSTGQMLIELFSYVGDMISYYIERTAQESYIRTARRRSSVLNLVKVLNYSPRRRVSATGILTFSISATHSKNIFIPKYTECETAAGIKFVTSEDAVILAGSTETGVTAVQGEAVTVSIVSSGGDDQELSIEDEKVENTVLELFVEDELWEKVDSFIYAESDSKYYVVRNELDDTVSILFGNSVYGKAPAEGESRVVKYVRSDGADGNVFSSGLVTTVNSTLYDSDEATMDVDVTNADVLIGGVARQGTEDIRYSAPRVFSTGDRAVTKDDFDIILNNYPGVANATAWGEAEVDSPDYDMFNTVKFIVIAQDWQDPSDSFKTTLGEYLYDKALMTVKYEYASYYILEVVAVLSLKVFSGYTLSEVQANAEEVIEDDFVLGDTTKLGVDKQHSNLVASVDNLDGVSHCYLTLQIKKELEANYDSFNNYGETLLATDIKAGTVRLYLNDDIIGADDGEGSLTSSESGITVTGTIDYTTGVIGVDITPAPEVNDEVYVRYQQDEDGDLIVDKDQICRLDDVDVQSISFV